MAEGGHFVNEEKRAQSPRSADTMTRRSQTQCIPHAFGGQDDIDHYGLFFQLCKITPDFFRSSRIGFDNIQRVYVSAVELTV